MTSRRALVLVGQLLTSPTSRYRAASLGDPFEFAGYGRMEAMTADLIDRVNDLSYISAKAAGGKPRKPQPYPRPEAPAEPETDSAVTATDIDEFPIWEAVALTTK